MEMMWLWLVLFTLLVLSCLAMRSEPLPLAVKPPERAIAINEVNSFLNTHWEDPREKVASSWEQESTLVPEIAKKIRTTKWADDEPVESLRDHILCTGREQRLEREPLAVEEKDALLPDSIVVEVLSRNPRFARRVASLREAVEYVLLMSRLPQAEQDAFRDSTRLLADSVVWHLNNEGYES